jgi:hypothetical protein
MGLLGIGGGLGGIFGGGDQKAGGGQGDGEEKVSFRQVYAQAMPRYLQGKGGEGAVYTGDETTQRYYKQLKALNKSEANSCTVLSYDA